ncbi:MerR family transcriptional regulator [Bittarella massiliensis (ex Durand et al. 2017)]|uniref:MerR family transcriptional regulator n=1 Tax=Bittarella massiliensis (ex Durand et al. 2017) TaxID=1720313 RepID=UPI001AA0C9E8|nr:MerR family transcriptional regulator [Bittarella massiliensis (ex Durand et al. 2017)]MBO1679954.1 MerR family transcriptional regulator [Bittarella massiliensis (ex Durand et al. 2017)]
MTIAAVSRTYDLSADTLRYYERIGLIPPVHRSAGGIREYDEEDCRWGEFIKCMRGAGLPIESLVEYVALFQQGEETAPARKLLVEQRQRLAERIEEMQAVLTRPDYKIDGYDRLAAAGNKLRRSRD